MKSNINFSYLIFLSVVAALGGFLFGYDAAVISGTISQVTVKFGLDEIQIGWFVGCALIGSIIGVLFAGKLSDMWGRKVTMLIAAVFFSVSGIGCAFSDSLEQLVFARMLGGIGIGIDSDQHDRDLRFQCDVVESFFPVGVAFTGSFGSDCKMKLRSFGKDLCHLFYQ